jgi:hypothetical protein
MNSTYEFNHESGLTAFKIKDHHYGIVEFTIVKHLDHKGGKKNVSSSCTTFFTKKEFKEFFTPLINDLKVRFENADDTGGSNSRI